MKKLLFDLNHPAHFYLFHHVISELKKTNDIYITAKKKDVLLDLLSKYNYKFDVLEYKERGDKLYSSAINLIKRDYKLFKLIRIINPDLVIGTSVSITHVGKILRIPSLYFGEDGFECVPLSYKFAYPFATYLITPDNVSVGKYNKKQIKYCGYHELAYLHPNRFQPDVSVLKEAGIKEGEKFFIMRFNAFKAHHDIGIMGISLQNKLKLVNLLNEYGKVFITTEREIEPELKQYQYKLHPAKIHSFLNYATMFIGDSQTMTSEAVVLGIPAFKCNSFAGRLSVHNELENKYGLCFSYNPQDFSKMLDKIKSVLNNPNSKIEWACKKVKMIEDKIDVTTFLVWFLENYPDSVTEFTQNPNLQYQFK